jgi:hypothetical protein
MTWRRTVDVPDGEEVAQLVLLGGLWAVGRQHDHELAEVDAVVEEGQALGEGVDGELGDAEELIGADEALRRRPRGKAEKG